MYRLFVDLTYNFFYFFFIFKEKYFIANETITQDMSGLIIEEIHPEPKIGSASEDNIAQRRKKY